MNEATCAYLSRLERCLRRAPRKRPFTSDTWAAEVPSAPGVYALWRQDSGALVHVGETANLRKRMRDLGRSVNHTARRKIAARLGLDAVSEQERSRAMRDVFCVSYLPVELGRAELEEYLTFRWRCTLFNSPSPRAHAAARFSRVKPGRPPHAV